MQSNALPKYDMSDNPTDCCPRFQSQGWDDQELHFRDKLFVKAKTRSFAHIPVNMGPVFKKTFKAIEDAHALSDEDFIVMSRDESPWSAEHLFSVTREVPGQQMIRLSGDYLTKVFEGPYKNAPKWQKDMEQTVRDHSQEVAGMYFFYTTCPKCARTYGKNYVVAVAQVTSALD